MNEVITKIVGMDVDDAMKIALLNEHAISRNPLKYNVRKHNNKHVAEYKDGICIIEVSKKGNLKQYNMSKNVETLDKLNGYKIPLSMGINGTIEYIRTEIDTPIFKLDNKQREYYFTPAIKDDKTILVPKYYYTSKILNMTYLESTIGNTIQEYQNYPYGSTLATGKWIRLDKTYDFIPRAYNCSNSYCDLTDLIAVVLKHKYDTQKLDFSMDLSVVYIDGTKYDYNTNTKTLSFANAQSNKTVVSSPTFKDTLNNLALEQYQNLILGLLKESVRVRHVHLYEGHKPKSEAERKWLETFCKENGLNYVKKDTITWSE